MAHVPDLGAPLAIGCGLLAFGVLVALRAQAFRVPLAVLLLAAGLNNTLEGIGQVVGTLGGDRQLLRYVAEAAYLPFLPAALGLALALGGRRVPIFLWALLALPSLFLLTFMRVPAADGRPVIDGHLLAWVSIVSLLALAAVLVTDLGRRRAAPEQGPLAVVLLIVALPRAVLYAQELLPGWLDPPALRPLLNPLALLALVGLAAAATLAPAAGGRDGHAARRHVGALAALALAVAGVWAAYALPALANAAGGPIYAIRWAMAVVALWLAIRREGLLHLGWSGERAADLLFTASIGTAAGLQLAALGVGTGLGIAAAVPLGLGLVALTLVAVYVGRGIRARFGTA